MRFLLFDRVTHFEPGVRIEGVKCITLTEECLKGHFGLRPLFPGSLLIESMLQLSAWPAIARHDYGCSLVLLRIDDVEVPADLAPGVEVRITGELQSSNPKASVARATLRVDGERVGGIGRILYGHIPVPDPEVLRARFRYYGGTP